MNDRDPLTPKESGSLARWPIFEEMSRQTAGRLARMGLYEEQREANALAAQFKSWEKRDPGSNDRTRAIARLFLLRELIGL